MNTPQAALPTPLPVRRRYHRSTIAVFLIVVALFPLLNVPGQIVVGPNVSGSGKYGPHFEVCERFEHGWPVTYMRRESVIFNPAYCQLSPWNVGEGVNRFRLTFLIIGTATGLAIALSAASLFEIWRRQRTRLLQFYIRDLLVLTALVSVAFATYTFHRSQHAAEQIVMQAIANTKDPYVQWGCPITGRIEWQRGGPTWLRQLIGDPPFEPFDRVIGIDTSGAELQHVVKLRDLRVVRIFAVSNGQLALLEHLPQLEALDMCQASVVDDEDRQAVDEEGNTKKQRFRLPRMPNLRGLNLYETEFRGDGLDNIPAIEVLDLTGTDIDDESIPALSALIRLKELSLCGTSVSDSGMSQLRRALPDCEILDEGRRSVSPDSDETMPVGVRE